MLLEKICKLSCKLNSNKQNKIKSAQKNGYTDATGNLFLFENNENMVISCAIVGGYTDAMATPFYHQPTNSWYAKVKDTLGNENKTSVEVSIFYVYIDLI